MTVPTMTSAAVGNKVSATLFNNDVVVGIGDLVAGGTGCVGHSFLAAQTDYSSVGTPCSVPYTVVAGRNYRISAGVTGTQVTNTGTPTVKLLVAGVEVYRLITGVSLVAGVVAYGSVNWIYPAAGSGSVTFSITAQSSAASFRIAANAIQLVVEDVGTN